MVTSLIISYFVGKEIFIGFTPRVRPNLPTYLAKKISTPLLFLSSVVGDGKIKGIYVKEDANTINITIKEKEVSWQEYNVSKNGKNIKILLPEGEEQPSEKYLEGL